MKRRGCIKEDACLDRKGCSECEASFAVEVVVPVQCEGTLVVVDLLGGL